MKDVQSRRLKRLPQILRKFTGNAAETVIGSALGGLIYITVPPNKGLGTLSVNVTGKPWASWGRQHCLRQCKRSTQFHSASTIQKGSAASDLLARHFLVACTAVPSCTALCTVQSVILAINPISCKGALLQPLLMCYTWLVACRCHPCRPVHCRGHQ